MSNFFPLANSDLRVALSIIIVVVIAIVARLILLHTTHLFFGKVGARLKNEKTLARTQTARTLIVSMIDLVIILVAVLMILSSAGMNIAPILTGAGILGLAISFGSQSLVKDVISGFFIIFEEQFNVGDEVKIGIFEGVVHKLTLRSTVLKDVDGNLIFIPNSQITFVLRKKK